MPKNLGLYNNDLSVPRKKDIDALTLRVDTNEDNIAMAESDIDGLQTDVGALKTDVGQVKTALGSKQDTVTGGASTITDSNLTANRALVSNGSGKVAVSEVTSTELGYLDGVTSNVQTQLNKKLETAPVTSVNSKTGAVKLTSSDVGAINRGGDSVWGTFEFGDAFGGATVITGATPAGIHMYEGTMDSFVSVIVPSQDSENELGFFGGTQISGDSATVGTKAVRLVNIDKPVKNTDAANKAYVDENSGVPIISLTSTDGRSFKGTVDDIGVIAKEGNVIAVKVGYAATSDDITLNLNNTTAYEIVRIGTNGKFLDGISDIFIEGTVILLQCAVLSSDLKQGVWHIVGFNSKDSKDGVQILTQSAQPTAQGIGDFWFQEN